MKIMKKKNKIKIMKQRFTNEQVTILDSSLVS